ncbi:hypothetical protein F4777DRAFT_290176 [Nemania sp. FL0916]|nr:hypothetical protein F4777DRAFT_290176 [Nemania sp. FL0916]
MHARFYQIQCRGFSHSFVLFVRSTLKPACAPGLLKNSSRQLRPFSFSRILYENAAKDLPTGAKASQSPFTSSLAEQLQRSRPSSLSYAQRLAMKSHPTMLYEAAPQTSFLISSYSAALFCLCGGAVNSYFNIIYLPPEMPKWVGACFGAVTVMFAVIASIFALRPAAIIRYIKLLPDATARQAAHSAQGPRKSVMLEIAVRRTSLIPLPLKRIRVEPQHVVMVNRMFHQPGVLSREQQAAKTLADANRRSKEERQSEMDHNMTAPFRHLGDALKPATVLGNIRRGMTNEGFAPVFIDGVRYKLDIQDGRALEGGRALDQIVKIQSDLELARIQSENLKD